MAISFFGMTILTLAQRARQQIDSGHFDGALAILNGAAVDRVLAPDEYELLAETMLALDQAGAAVAVLENAIKSYPGNVALLTWLGQAYAVQDWHFDAAQLYREALALASDSRSLKIELGRAMFEMGQHQAAQQLFDAAQTIGELPRESRIVKRMTVKKWCGENRATGTYLAALAELDLRWPVPRVIPSDRTRDWGEPRYVIPPAYLARIANAEVHAQQFAVTTSDGSFFVDGLVTSPELFMRKRQLVQYADASGYALIERKMPAVEVDETCVLLAASSNHFHFVVEGLARLWHFEKFESLRNLPVLVAGTLAEPQKMMLAEMGVAANRLIEIPEQGSARCRDVWIPSQLSHGYGIRPEAIDFLRRKLLPASAQRQGGLKLYFSRNKLGRRAIVNEAELWPLLEQAGFSIVYPEELSFQAQRDLFFNADVILAADGSVLPNLIFCAPETVIGCIYTEGVHIPHYYFIAAALDLRFFYLAGQPVFTSHPNINHRDLSLASAYLREFLDAL